MKAKLSPKMAFIKAEMVEMEMVPMMDSGYDEISGFRQKMKFSEPEFSEPHDSLTPPYYPPPDAVPPKDNHYITPEGFIMIGPEFSPLRFDDDDFS